MLNGKFHEVITVIIPILHIRKLSLREVKRSNQGHTISKWLAWDLNPGCCFGWASTQPLRDIPSQRTEDLGVQEDIRPILLIKTCDQVEKIRLI